MGTWGAGPFDNDIAADFANELDEMAEEDRPEAIRAALAAAIDETSYLDSFEGAPAVAAAALVASQSRTGSPIESSHGPEQLIPQLPAALDPLAVQALDRVVGPDSELEQLWSEAGGASEWLAEINRLRTALLPPS